MGECTKLGLYIHVYISTMKTILCVLLSVQHLASNFEEDNATFSLRLQAYYPVAGTIHVCSLYTL